MTSLSNETSTQKELKIKENLSEPKVTTDYKLLWDLGVRVSKWKMENC